jgi:endonuclease YncB( thermonuclease family)
VTIPGALRPAVACAAVLVAAAATAADAIVAIEGCTLVPAEWADGDSFRVHTPAGEEHTVRLYGADCLEHHVTDETDARRLRSQRRYFGIAEAGSDTAASIEFAKRLGAEATAETRRLLTDPFTLHTSFADGRGDARFKRIYGFVTDAKGRDLAEPPPAGCRRGARPPAARRSAATRPRRTRASAARWTRCGSGRRRARTARSSATCCSRSAPPTLRAAGCSRDELDDAVDPAVPGARAGGGCGRLARGARLRRTMHNGGQMLGLLDRSRTVAPPGFNRWLVPPAALCIHLCIGMAYGFSVFWLPLTHAVGTRDPFWCLVGMPLAWGVWSTLRQTWMLLG